jgi:hypothetical protein
VGVWRSYSAILSVLPVETEMLTNLNILLLFTVSIEPYLFNQLFVANGSFWNNISILYAVDLAVMFFVLAYFNHSLGTEEKNLAPKNYLKKFRFDRNYDVFTAVLFMISALPFFEVAVTQFAGSGIPLRVFLWLGILIFGLIRRVVTPFLKK